MEPIKYDLRSWAVALKRLHDTGFNAMVIGGAMRDGLLRRPIKDIDVFVYDRWAHGVLRPSTLYDIADALGAEYLGRQGVPEGYERPVNADIGAILSYTGGWQVMLLENWPGYFGLVDRVDFALCGVGLSKDGDIYYRAGALDDMRHRTFTVTPSGGARPARTWKRWQRLRTKYPDFTLNDPTGSLVAAGYRE